MANQALNIIQGVILGLDLDPATTILKLSEVELLQPGAMKLIMATINEAQPDLLEKVYTTLTQSQDENSLMAAQILVQALNEEDSDSQEEAVPSEEELVAVARWGAKLNYLKKLQGIIPQGYQNQYFKVGGKIYSKPVEVQEPIYIPYAKCGKELKCGGTAVVKSFKKKRIEAKACGGSAKVSKKRRKS